jgi:hypothetical protein
MISMTLLSLSPETLQRMATHDAAGETSCRRAERVAALGWVVLVSVLAIVAAVIVV